MGRKHSTKLSRKKATLKCIRGANGCYINQRTDIDIDIDIAELLKEMLEIIEMSNESIHFPNLQIQHLQLPYQSNDADDIIDVFCLPCDIDHRDIDCDIDWVDMEAEDAFMDMALVDSNDDDFEECIEDWEILSCW